MGKKNRYHPATPAKGGRSGFGLAGSNGGGFFTGDVPVPEEIRQIVCSGCGARRCFAT